MTQESKVTSIDDSAPSKAPKVKAEAKSPASDGLGGDFVMLTIHPTSEDGGDQAVFVGHNGVGYQIPRGKAWKLPKEVAEVVSNALVTTFKPGPGGGVIETTVPRFAHSIVPA